MIERELNRRHMRGLFRLWHEEERFGVGAMLSIDSLEGAIGKYASNTILSLEDRNLIEVARVHPLAYRLTADGITVVDELRKEFTIVNQLEAL